MTHGEEYWDSVAQDWQRRRPQTLWRRHCDALHASLVQRWLPNRSLRSVLKTDLFDEAVGEGVWPLLASRAEEAVGIDISPVILEAARRKYPSMRAVRADVRRLPFPDGSFDVVFSNSTLDHFESRQDILVAMRELSRTLRLGGQLLLTMDNPANPAVWVRNLLPGRWQRRLGLVPYSVGATCGRRWLERGLRQAGLEVLEATAIMHCPRVLAVAAAEWMERRCSPQGKERFLRLLGAFERLGGFWTRYATGYFVALKAAKPEA
jgi:ubiquinone/menaquinone biosynthesis C-methylase UbiE